MEFICVPFSRKSSGKPTKNIIWRKEWSSRMSYEAAALDGTGCLMKDWTVKIINCQLRYTRKATWHWRYSQEKLGSMILPPCFLETPPESKGCIWLLICGFPLLLNSVFPSLPPTIFSILLTLLIHLDRNKRRLCNWPTKTYYSLIVFSVSWQYFLLESVRTQKEQDTKQKQKTKHLPSHFKDFCFFFKVILCGCVYCRVTCNVIASFLLPGAFLSLN